MAASSGSSAPLSSTETANGARVGSSRPRAAGGNVATAARVARQSDPAGHGSAGGGAAVGVGASTRMVGAAAGCAGVGSPAQPVTVSMIASQPTFECGPGTALLHDIQLQIESHSIVQLSGETLHAPRRAREPWHGNAGLSGQAPTALVCVHSRKPAGAGLY